MDLPGWLRGDGFESIDEPHFEEEKRFSSGGRSSGGSNSNRNSNKKSPSNRPPPDVRDTVAAPSTPLLNMKTPEKENVEAELDELDGDCCFCPLDPILWWFALFTVIAGAAALAGMLINVIYIAKHSDLDPRSILLRVYAAVFCGGIVMIEIDWRFIVSRLRIMDLWLIRGAFYGYVGLITCSEDENELAPLNVIGCLISAVGVVYMMMGLCCMKTVSISNSAKICAPSRFWGP
jgi:hypothetical protein